jgi:hypothetical protein
MPVKEGGVEPAVAAAGVQFSVVVGERWVRILVKRYRLLVDETTNRDNYELVYM